MSNIQISTIIYSIYQGDDYSPESIEVHIQADMLENNKHFGHSQVKFHQERYRSLDEHIKFFTELAENLKQLKAKMERRTK